MQFYDDFMAYNTMISCGCDDHCGSDSFGCDNCSCDIDN